MRDVKVPAAEHTLRILSLLARSRGPLAASMIAAQLSLPRSTVYHLLAALQEHGYVIHLPNEKRFGLGIAAVELSSAYSRHEPLSRIGRPIVATLVDALGMSGHLAVPHGRDVLYIVEERAPGSPSLVSDIDVRLPMQLTASGRAVLATLPRAQVRALFPDAEAFVHRHDTHETIDRYSRLRAVLDETRTRGYGLERGSVTPGLASIGVPVCDHRGWPVAGLAVTFAEELSDNDDALEAVSAQVHRAAQQVSTRIYGKLPQQ